MEDTPLENSTLNNDDSKITLNTQNEEDEAVDICTDWGGKWSFEGIIICRFMKEFVTNFCIQNNTHMIIGSSE